MQGYIRSDDDRDFTFINLMLATIRIPPELVLIDWANLTTMLKISSNVWDPVSVDGNILLRCVEGIQDDLTLLDLPYLQLLLGDVRVVCVVIEVCLLDRYLDASFHEIETLVKCLLQLLSIDNCSTHATNAVLATI